MAEVDTDFLIKIAKRQDELERSIDLLTDKGIAMNEILLQQSQLIKEFLIHPIEDDVININGKDYIPLYPTCK